MNRLTARLHQEEGGAALVICLAFLAFVGVMAVALLNYSSTNLKATVKLRELRADLSAADAFAEMAIAETRQQDGSSRVSSPYCYSGSGKAVNGKVMHVQCSSTDFKDVTFTVCYHPCNAADVRLVAGVRYDTTAPGSPAKITSWSVRK